jgi:hypothetical protein
LLRKYCIYTFVLNAQKNCIVFFSLHLRLFVILLIKALAENLWEIKSSFVIYIFISILLIFEYIRVVYKYILTIYYKMHITPFMKVDFFIFSEREPLGLEDVGAENIKNVRAKYGRGSTCRLNVSTCDPLYFHSRKCLFVQKLRDPLKYVSFVAFVRNVIS